MSYKLFTAVVKGKKVFCTENKETKKVVKYKSEEDRKKGIKIRERWKPRKK